MIDRYYLKEMKEIWSEKNYYRKWKEVEAAVLKARGMDDLALLVLKEDIDPEEVREKEKISGHELNAFLSILEERIGPSAGEIHKGLTSSDVMDTARVLQIKDSLELTLKKLKKLKNILKNKAVEYKDTVMCGKTHGQIAEPVTLGLKFARWHVFAMRNIERVEEASKRILVGTISGAVGTYSLVSPGEEKKTLDYLGLKPAPAASQVLPRDIFCEYIFVLSLISALAGEISCEIRLLSQDFIKEVSEPFMSKQTGSSAMPHKKNPVLCERISGLSRLVGNYTQTGLSNIALWNERDISHSSNERIVLEEASSLTCYILEKINYVAENLTVHKKNIKKNLEKAGMRLYSSSVLKLLLDKGVERKEAYSLAKKIFMQGKSIEEIEEILEKKHQIKPEELAAAMKPEAYLGNVEEIFKRAGVI